MWGDEGVGKPPGVGGTSAQSGLDTVLRHQEAEARGAWDFPRVLPLSVRGQGPRGGESAHLGCGCLHATPSPSHTGLETLRRQSWPCLTKASLHSVVILAP